MNEIIAFSLITFLGILPIALLVTKIIFKNSIAFYNTSVFIIALILAGNIIHIFAKINYSFIFGLIPIGIVIIVSVSYFFYYKLKRPINLISRYLENMSKGETLLEIPNPENNFIEFNTILKSIRRLNSNLIHYKEFINDIKNGKLDSSVLNNTEGDLFAISLLEMKNNLVIDKQDDEKRKAEDNIRNWNNVGVNKIVETLRHNNKNLFDLSFEVLSDIIQYLEANVGGIFIIENDDNGRYLELIASYAYDRRKFLEKRIEIKEGLIGACALEQKTIYMSKVPKDYMNISTGLGEGDPRAVLIVPLKIDEETIGVMELATFKGFKKYEIAFVENICENIASMLLNLKRQKETDALLEENMKQTEMISQQKEETQLYYAELQDVQEELENLENELQIKNNEIAELKKRLNI